MNQEPLIFSGEDLVPILNSINDAIFIDDASGHCLWCNRACEVLYRVRPEEIQGKHVSYLEETGIFNPSVARMVLEQKKEVTIIHENKAGKRLLSTGIPILDQQGKISKIITTSRDITELQNLQSRLESMESTLKDLKTTQSLSARGLVAGSPAMFNVFQLVKRLSHLDSTVLITGESGVGKGVIARLLHENGSRKDFPFVQINCGAIPENLIESELFGYEPGSFTGARNEVKKGLFEVAEKGSLFLDEISELPLNLQVKLLQVIQEREIKRVGGVKSIPIDVRIISATNRDLHEQVILGKFREDLYYRLNVVPINVPPLRERHEDILPLIRSVLDTYNKRLGENKKIDGAALAVLLKYNWPGNIREVHNIIERLVITTRGDLITPEHLPGFIKEASLGYRTAPLSAPTLKESLEQAEKEVLLSASRKYRTTREMARALDISQPSVVRKLTKYGIRRE